MGSEKTARLVLNKEGTGRLYYTLRMRYAPSSFEKAASEGLTITKTVKPLYGDGKKLVAGARAVVTLTVTTPQARTFIAIEDPLPGGFEIVDPTFATEGQEDQRAVNANETRNPYWGTFERNENYDDHIAIFADYLPAGEHTYSYLIQATTPGDFHMPATFVEAMYEPEIFGRTASDEAKIK
jgi:uncharacterized protein YfaS (alpha-2-macroglobulin family)